MTILMLLVIVLGMFVVLIGLFGHKDLVLIMGAIILISGIVMDNWYRKLPSSIAKQQVEEQRFRDETLTKLNKSVRIEYPIPREEAFKTGIVVSDPQKIANTGMSKVVVERKDKTLVARLVSDTLLIKKGDSVKLAYLGYETGVIGFEEVGVITK